MEDTGLNNNNNKQKNNNNNTGKGKDGVKCTAGLTGLCGQLYHKDQIPEPFHEHFIINGYRSPQSTAKQCAMSLFDATNETLNFWTHFIPSLYFMWVLRDTYVSLDLHNDSYTWPLLAYMCMTCLVTLISCLAHTFNTMSDKARHICFFLDYCSLSGFSLSVCVAYKAYSFPLDLITSGFGDYYIPIAVTMGPIMYITACQTRFMKVSTIRQILRLSALGSPFLYSSFPIIYCILLGTPEELNRISWSAHATSVFCMFACGLIYGTHLPERLFPGKFDIVGHSHQLFHIVNSIGIYTQLYGVMQDMQMRREELIRDWQFHSLMSSVGIVGSIMLIELAILSVMSYRLYACNKLKHS